MEKLAKEEYIPQRYYTFVENTLIGDMSCMISKTGYTGEMGYEIYCQNEHAPILWDKLLAAGEAFGVVPCGLGARDTLRMEAAMPLYGHELGADISPDEAGLSSFIKLNKPAFLGKQALSNPRKRKRIGLKLVERGIVREGAKVWLEDKEIGFVTSGTMSPTLGEAIAMALVPVDFDGHDLIVEVRGKGIAAQVAGLPFYKKKQ
jgi:aminomethyltransferase